MINFLCMCIVGRAVAGSVRIYEICDANYMNKNIVITFPFNEEHVYIYMTCVKFLFTVHTHTHKIVEIHSARVATKHVNNDKKIHLKDSSGL